MEQRTPRTHPPPALFLLFHARPFIFPQYPERLPQRPRSRQIHPFLQGLRQLGAVEFAFIFRHQDAHHLVQSGIRQAARFGLGLRAQAFEEQDAGCCEVPRRNQR